MQPAEIPTIPRRKWVTAQANALSRVYRTPPVPVEEIAEQNGVQVVLADFEDNRDEVSGVCDFEQKKILVNFADLPARRRFTIAHELGHWMLHRGIYQANPDKYRFLPRFRWTDDAGPLEQEANRFAAHLLVPDRLLVPVAQVATASTLADIFGVSRTMMEIRMNSVLG